MSVNEYNPNSGNGFFGNGSDRRDYTWKNSEMRPTKKDPDEIDLKRLFFTLWHNKWIIVGSVLLFSILAGIFAYTVTPIYRSEGSMLIKDSGNSFSMGSNDGLASLLSSSYGIGMGSSIGNELQILRSRKLANELADSLLRKRRMVNGRQFPVLFSSYPEDSTLAKKDTVAFRLRNNFTFSQVDRESDLVNISFESPSPLEAAFMVNLSMKLYSDISTRQNRLAAHAAVNFLESERTRIEDQLNLVEQRLREFMNREKLIQVDAQTEKLIERMADLESRRQEASIKLVTIRSAIDQYRERLNSIKPGLAGQYADAIGPNMTRLQYQLAELEIEKMQLQANNPQLKEEANPTGKLAELNDKIAFYRERIRKLTDNLMEQSDQYLGFLGSADGNIAQSVTQLNQKLIELKVEEQQYRAQIEVLDPRLEEEKHFFDNLPDNMIELARLKRDVTINEELFLTVSKQFAEMSLWEQTQFGLGRPVDDGFVPQKPVKPNKKLYILVGFIIGGVLSVAFIFMREAFNTRIDSIEKMESFNIPLLAVIPSMNKFIQNNHKDREQVTLNNGGVSTSMISLLDSVSPVSESFRRLQSNIVYSNPDTDLNTIMITSATQGEGKTTIASNLGVVLAEAGNKVVVVDADLRRPQIHNQFTIDRAPGIFEYCFENVELDLLIKPTVVDNLKVLPAGKEPPNASALTQSSIFLDLIKQLEKRFDYVVLDTPPFGIINDVSALIKQTDGVVVISRFNQTSQVELANLLKNLDQIHANVLGSVLSDFDFSETSNYSFDSHYYKKIIKDYESYQSPT